ncbi:hypothetical protein O6H91_Y416200 [Diphasiastrum complanatum]|nr:hypothetical protein O6H91_Y416200 [Diphasiastrum complanatum]
MYDEQITKEIFYKELLETLNLISTHTHTHTHLFCMMVCWTQHCNLSMWCWMIVVVQFVLHPQVIEIVFFTIHNILVSPCNLFSIPTMWNPRNVLMGLWEGGRAMDKCYLYKIYQLDYLMQLSHHSVFP